MPLPAGPALPGWSQAQAWIEDPIRFWEGCRDEFGDIFTVQLGSLGAVVLFSQPEAVRKVFQLPAESYECRQYNEQYKYVMGGESLLLSDGPRHRSRRRLLMSPLHQALTPQLACAIQRLTSEMVDSWPRGEPISVRPAIHLLSLRIMLDVLFGDLGRPICQEIQQRFKDEILQDLGTWSPWRRFGRLHPLFRELISSEVRAAREATAQPPATLFDTLAQARDNAGDELADDEIQDHVFTMLVAGVDPTAIAITWALYWIQSSPEVKETLARELTTCRDAADPLEVAELPYLSAVCQEVLRMYPVVTTPTGRKLTTRVEIGGWQFEPGVTLLPCTYLVHHRADLYPEPDRFRPERFLDRQFGPHQYFPFGGGNRTCIGATLAPLEIKLALATILRRLDLELANPGPVRPVRHGTLLAPPESMTLIATGPSSRSGHPY
jgi:cytochrome P450